MREKQVVTVCNVECKAPAFMFLPWEEMTSEQQDALVEINCEGSGVMSLGCEGCRYGRVYNVFIDSEEDID